MKLREDIDLEENTMFNADIYNRTDNSDYGDLYGRIDDARRKIIRLRDSYTNELKNIEKRREYQKNSVYMNILFIVVLLIAALLVTAISNGSLGSGDLASTFQVFSGTLLVILIYIFIIYVIIRTVKAFFVYMINKRPDFMSCYVKSHNIKTFIDGAEYFNSLLAKLQNYQAVLLKIETEIKNQTINPDDAKKQLDEMDLTEHEFNYTFTSSRILTK